MVRWFSWFGWFTEKVESWLENKAAEGWHLIKADRMLNRFHFKKGAPKQVRVCADYPAEASDEYKTIFQDSGWELVCHGLGWYIWQAEYTGDERPEAFNDPEPLIERNNRLLIILAFGLFGLLLQLPIQGLLNVFTARFFTTALGQVLLGLYVLLIVVIAVSIGLTFGHNRKLKDRML